MRIAVPNSRYTATSSPTEPKPCAPPASSGSYQRASASSARRSRAGSRQSPTVGAGGGSPGGTGWPSSTEPGAGRCAATSPYQTVSPTPSPHEPCRAGPRASSRVRLAAMWIGVVSSASSATDTSRNGSATPRCSSARDSVARASGSTATCRDRNVRTPCRVPEPNWWKVCSRRPSTTVCAAWAPPLNRTTAATGPAPHRASTTAPLPSSPNPRPITTSCTSLVTADSPPRQGRADSVALGAGVVLAQVGAHLVDPQPTLAHPDHGGDQLAHGAGVFQPQDVVAQQQLPVPHDLLVVVVGRPAGQHVEHLPALLELVVGIADAEIATELIADHPRHVLGGHPRLVQLVADDEEVALLRAPLPRVGDHMVGHEVSGQLVGLALLAAAATLQEDRPQLLVHPVVRLELPDLQRHPVRLGVPDPAEEQLRVAGVLPVPQQPVQPTQLPLHDPRHQAHRAGHVEQHRDGQRVGVLGGVPALPLSHPERIQRGIRTPFPPIPPPHRRRAGEVVLSAGGAVAARGAVGVVVPVSVAHRRSPVSSSLSLADSN